MTQFTLINHEAEKTFVEDSRADAEGRKQLGIDDFGYAKEELDVVQGEYSTYADAPTQTATDGGNTEVVENATPVQEPDLMEDEPTDQLPDDGPSISEDPLTWMPGEFTETVDGTVTITRKGYEVLAHHYDVQGGTDMVVSPVETDMEYTVHKATVTDADGDTYTAYGEAHAGDNGVENIVRMSDTRAYKRAVSRATGVGTIAIEELQNEL